MMTKPASTRYNYRQKQERPSGALTPLRPNTQEGLAPMCPPNDTQTPKRKYPSRAERRARRLARGLTPAPESDRRWDKLHQKERTKRQYDKRRAFVDSVKLERGCADCGYKAHPAALQFDHLPGTEKKHIIAQMLNHTSMEKLIAEMQKCEVVCANCHSVRTFERRKNEAAA